MTSKKNTLSTPVDALVPAPTEDKVDMTKNSPTLDVRSTVSNHFYQDTTAILVAVPINTTLPDATNTPVDPTEAL